MTRTPIPRLVRLAVTGVALATVLAGLNGLSQGSAGAAPVVAHVTAHVTKGNPLVGTWGVDTTMNDSNPAYEAWVKATGTTKQLIARIALRPRVQWFGAWQSSDRIHRIVSDYIATIHSTNRNAIALMAMFGIPKWESPENQRHWSKAEIADWHKWVDQAASAIGANRVAMVLQPDLIYATQNSNPSVPLSMIAYAAKKFGSLPNTTIYLDAGARDYVPPKGVSMVNVLRSAGIKYARGFSLDDTHHDAINSEIGYGNTLAAGLARAGLPNHFVINTAGNGRPTTVAQMKTYVDNPACSSAKQKLCIALGIPPTTATSDTHWGLTAANRAIAARLVDAYLWVDRVWITSQSKGGVYSVQRSVNLGRWTPFVASTPKSSTTPLRLGSVPTSAAPGSKRVTYTVLNSSAKQNLTVDAVSFSSTTNGKYSAGPGSSCRAGVLVAPRTSCSVVVRFTPVKAGASSTVVNVATNTNNRAYRKVTATVTP